MTALLEEMDRRGAPAEGDFDICSQLWRVRRDSGVDDRRILSEIGILFVEGFETTGHTISWTLFNIATVPGESAEQAGLVGWVQRLYPRL
jgi:cytochrome P450